VATETRLRRAALPLGAAVLFLLNVWISWRLFFTEYTEHFGSVEPFFFTIARQIRLHWPDLGWWPAWNTGMPFDYTYQPLLHYVVAALSALSGWPEGRSYHFVVGTLCAAAPATVYALMLRFTGRPWVSLVAGLAYTFWSPTAVLIEKAATDMGAWWYPRRLFTAIAWADAPHVVGLALIPLAIVLLDRALDRRSAGSYLMAAIAVASVPLMNIPAAMASAMAVIAYALAIDRSRWRTSWPRTFGVGLLGYALFAPWLPPSALALATRNVQWMNRDGNITLAKLPYYLAITGAIVLATLILPRLKVPFAARFAALLTLLSAPLVLLDAWAGVELIGQAGRFHLVMDMAILFLLCSALPAMRLRAPAAVAAAVVITGLCALGWMEHRYFVRRIVNKSDPTDRSEYRIARWMDENAGGSRVYVAGSTAFWFNYWTGTPQVAGCCDQNALTTAIPIARYVIGTDDGAGDRGAEISIIWLQVLGARYVAVSGPISSDVYKDFRDPLKFDGLLEERWHEYDDVIYEVPLGSDSLAHAVRPEELVQQMPSNGVDIDPLLRYRAALLDPERPAAEFAWRGTKEAVIRGALPAGSVFSVQIPYHFGWRAETASGPARLGKDAIGFLTVAPDCEGSCEVRLVFNGEPERTALRAVSVAAWLAVGVWLTRRKRAPGQNLSRHAAEQK
jgi:hypothetical protein